MSAHIQFSSLTPTLGELLISQPQKRNALTADMWAQLPRALEEAKAKPGLRVLIVRGDGDHFASGADISEFQTLYAHKVSAETASSAIAKGTDALADFPLPTIALIRGTCVGGGCALALACDMRFSDASAKFAITPAKLGLTYPYNDVQRLIETVGVATAKDILFSARVLDAHEAQQKGLIHALINTDDLGADVTDYARKIAALSPQSIKITKQMFKAYQAGQRFDTAQTERWFKDSFFSEDFKKGYKAFLDKRKPDFH